MAFEPQVERSIKRHRQRRLLYRLLVISPLIIVVAASILFVALSARADKGPELYPGLRSSTSFVIPVILIRFLPYFFIIGVAFYKLLMPAIRQFNSLTSEITDYDHHSFQRYKNALQAVSIGSGIATPALVVLDIPTANAIAFRKKGTPAVGVTRELLEADLTSSEVEAVMAHEVSHLVAGDEIRSPNVFTGVGGVVIVLVAVALPFLYSFGSFAYSFSMLALSLFLLPVMVLVGIPLSLHLMMRPYSISRRNPTYYHNEIFADSVAAKLTSNPGALKGAIEKLTGLMRRSEDMPRETIGFTQLFVGPLKKWPLDMDRRVPGILEALGQRRPEGQTAQPLWLVSLAERLGVPGPSRDRYIDAMEKAREKQVHDYIGWEEKLQKSRLHNLEMIEMNKWEAFQVRGGRLIVPPDKWFR